MSTPRDSGSEPTDAKPERQPEALANFAATARSDDKVSPTGGRAATPETEPRPADPEAKAEAATKVLREGSLHVDQGAGEAVDRLPDRTRSTDR